MARVDWNIAKNHTFTMRYNQTNGKKDNAFSSPGMGMGDGRVSIYSMVFDGSNWRKVDNVYSLTGELNRRIGKKITHKLRGSFKY